MKKGLPALILFVAVVITAALIFLKPATTEVTPLRPVPNVEVIQVQPKSIQLTVNSQGTVLPHTETQLSVEVSGRIIEVSKNFRAGSYIEKNEILLRIDPADYEARVATQTADLANARLMLAQEEALAEQARADWEAMGEGEPSDLALRKPQLAQARTRIESAKALLKQAQRDLARTAVRAPYSGRVLSTSVDLGQYLSGTPAAPIAQIYATDHAEIRLPITQREATFLDTSDSKRLGVRITNPNNPNTHVWHGKLDRLEATIDPSSRLLYAVAEVQDAFQEPALRRGQFVEAEISGQTIQQAYSIPRDALRGSDTVYIATPENTLQTRTVEIIKSDAKQVVILSGLEPGEWVVTSPIAYFIEDMPITVIETP